MEIEQSLDIKTDTLFDRAVLYIAVFCFVMTIVLVSIQVSLRHTPLAFGWGYLTEPVSRYTLIVGTYFGAAAAARNKEHISMYFMLERVERIAPRFHAGLRVFVAIIVTAFLIIATAATVFAATNNWRATFGGVYVVTIGQMFVLISTGFGLYLIYSILDLRDSIVVLNERLRDGTETETETE